MLYVDSTEHSAEGLGEERTFHLVHRVFELLPTAAADGKSSLK